MTFDEFPMGPKVRKLFQTAQMMERLGYQRWMEMVAQKPSVMAMLSISERGIMEPGLMPGMPAEVVRVAEIGPLQEAG